MMFTPFQCAPVHKYGLNRLYICSIFRLVYTRVISVTSVFIYMSYCGKTQPKKSGSGLSWQSSRFPSLSQSFVGNALFFSNIVMVTTKQPSLSTAVCTRLFSRDRLASPLSASMGLQCMITYVSSLFPLGAIRASLQSNWHFCPPFACVVVKSLLLSDHS